MAIAPGGGLHIDSSEAQQWALEVRMQRDEPDELRSQVLHGVSLRVTFNEPAYCSSSRTVQRRLVEKEEDVLRSLRVYTRHGDALTFTPADVDVGESEYVLFVASPSPRRRVEGWLSLFSPSLASNASTLTVVLAHSDEHTAGSIGYELGTDLRVEFAGPTCEWVGADRSPLERREYTFAPATPAAISFNTIVQLADDEQEQEEFQDSNAFGQGGEEQQEETPNLYKHMKAPKSDFDIPAPEPVEASIHSIYTEFIQAEKPGGGKASRLAYATEAGWHAGRKFRRQLDPTTAFVGIHEYLKGEEAVGVATGFLISGVVEGLSPNAFNQGTNKLQNLGDKHLVPLTIDNLCGSPDGVEGKEAGVSGTADGAGILSISTANDLIQMVPRMVEQIAIDFAALLSQELHASLTISVKEPLEDDLVRALGKTLGAAVPQTLSEIVPIAIKRILPGYILHALTNTLTHTLTRALTHSLTHTLQHTLTRTPAYERACYECQFFKRECHKCADGFDQRRQHIAGYYAEHYASYFSDYFSDYFTKGEGSLDADTPKILACYYGEGEASEAECGVYRVGEGGEGGRFTRTVE